MRFTITIIKKWAASVTDRLLFIAYDKGGDYVKNNLLHLTVLEILLVFVVFVKMSGINFEASFVLVIPLTL